MAKAKIVIHEDGLVAFLKKNKPVRDMLVGTARSVANEAQQTADSAQKGAGGRLDGYAQAGFSVEWQGRNKRPRVNIKSNADIETALAAHFYTQRRDGVGHLRKALYKFTQGN